MQAFYTGLAGLQSGADVQALRELSRATQIAPRGDLEAATRHLKRAVELDGHNLKALYSLAEQTERQREAQSDTGRTQIQ